MKSAFEDLTTHSFTHVERRFLWGGCWWKVFIVWQNGISTSEECPSPTQIQGRLTHIVMPLLLTDALISHQDGRFMQQIINHNCAHAYHIVPPRNNLNLLSSLLMGLSCSGKNNNNNKNAHHLTSPVIFLKANPKLAIFLSPSASGLHVKLSVNVLKRAPHKAHPTSSCGFSL